MREWMNEKSMAGHTIDWAQLSKSIECWWTLNDNNERSVGNEKREKEKKREEMKTNVRPPSACSCKWTWRRWADGRAASSAWAEPPRGCVRTAPRRRCCSGSNPHAGPASPWAASRPHPAWTRSGCTSCWAAGLACNGTGSRFTQQQHPPRPTESIKVNQSRYMMHHCSHFCTSEKKLW